MSIVEAIELGRRSNPMGLDDRIDSIMSLLMQGSGSTGIPSARDIYKRAARSVSTTEMMAQRLEQEREKTRQMQIAVTNAEHEVYRKRQQDLERRAEESRNADRQTTENPDKERQQGDYDMTMRSLLSGDTSPFLNYMRVYGTKDQNLENIEVSPDGKEFLVTIEGQKQPIPMDAEKFKMFTGAVNPKILESMANRFNQQSNRVEESNLPELPPYTSFDGYTTKDGEPIAIHQSGARFIYRNGDWRLAGGEMALSEQRARAYNMAREEASKEYKRMFTDLATGALKAGAPNPQAWMEERFGGKRSVAPAIQTSTRKVQAQGDAGTEDEEKSEKSDQPFYYDPARDEFKRNMEKSEYRQNMDRSEFRENMESSELPSERERKKEKKEGGGDDS